MRIRHLLSVILTAVMILTATVPALADEASQEIEIQQEAQGDDQGEIQGEETDVATRGASIPTISGTWVKNSRGKWLFKDSSTGKYVTGFAKISGTTYYFNSSNIMLTGWQKINNIWYYFASSGAMKTGWQKISKKWYYFNSNGEMLTGVQKIGSSTYIFNSSGAMLTGWQKVNNKWYYLASSGSAKISTWFKSGKTWYYFDGEGVMATGPKTIGGTLYLFSSGGAMLTGWQKYSGEWYYLTGSGTAYVDGWHRVGSREYYFGEDGKMFHDTTIEGCILDSNGYIIGYTDIDDDDDDDPTETEITSFSQVVTVARMMSGEADMNCTYAIVECHIPGYNDPQWNSGTISVSGWTYVALKYNGGSDVHFMKAADFDMTKFRNGGYGYDSAFFCNLPGEQVTFTINPSDEYNTFAGWSYKQDYKASDIVSTSRSITVAATKDTHLYAHCNSLWTGSYVDLKVVNNGDRYSPQTWFIVRHVPCIRNSNGRWTVAPVADYIEEGVAYYGFYAGYYDEVLPNVYNPVYYDFFMYDPDTPIADHNVTVEVQIDDRGYESDEVYKIIYHDPDSGITVMAYPDGTIRNKEEWYEDGLVIEVDPYTGQEVRRYVDPAIEYRLRTGSPYPG
ncbi:Glucan-binding domain-containing protein (YG repeat) [Ruminococcaceae bacterium YRB3002]|nr:Glucan-binding domain-containing protein (YG repeat) [Ruminococcaceae bacterium YRB3002]